MSFINEKNVNTLKNVSGKALERIALEKFAGSENYGIVVCLLCALFPEVVRVIDGIVESGQKINDYVCGKCIVAF